MRKQKSENLLRDPTSNKVKSIKAMVGIDDQIIQLAEDTGSPVFFLYWAITKEIMDKSKKTRFITADILNLVTQFVNYKKQPILILGALKKPTVSRLGGERSQVPGNRTQN